MGRTREGSVTSSSAKHKSSTSKLEKALEKSREIELPKARECHLCHLTLSRPGDLARHMRRHYNETDRAAVTHHCPWPGCDYEDLQRSNVNTHIRVHTGEKPNKCPDCQFASSDPGSLTRHRKRKHAYVPPPRAKRAAPAHYGSKRQRRRKYGGDIMDDSEFTPEAENEYRERHDEDMDEMTEDDELDDEDVPLKTISTSQEFDYPTSDGDLSSHSSISSMRSSQLSAASSQTSVRSTSEEASCSPKTGSSDQIVMMVHSLPSTSTIVNSYPARNAALTAADRDSDVGDSLADPSQMWRDVLGWRPEFGNLDKFLNQYGSSKDSNPSSSRATIAAGSPQLSSPLYSDDGEFSPAPARSMWSPASTPPLSPCTPGLSPSTPGLSPLSAGSSPSSAFSSPGISTPRPRSRTPRASDDSAMSDASEQEPVFSPEESTLLDGTTWNFSPARQFLAFADLLDVQAGELELE